MYKVVETEKALADIEKLKAEKLYDKYLKIRNQLQENPTNPKGHAKKHFGKIKGKHKGDKDIWHIDINSKRRIFYSINKISGELIIEGIEYSGIINIISAFEYDLRRK